MEKSTKIEFLFICQTDEGLIKVGTQKEIDDTIKYCEDNNTDLFFKVIGKVPLQGLTVDFPPSRIVWYEEGEKEKTLVDKVVMTIINYIF